MEKNLPVVCHIISGLGVGGAEKFLLKLIKKTEGSSVQHKVLVLGGEGKLSLEYSQHCQVVHAKVSSGVGALSFLKALREIGEADIYHGWLVYGHLFSFLINTLRFKKGKLVWGVRQTLDSKLKMTTQSFLSLNKYLSKYTDKIVFNSMSSLEQHRKFGYNCEKAAVIPNGFSLPKKVPSETTVSECRRSIGVPLTSRVYLMPARWDQDKGHTVLFEALGEILPEISQDAHFVFAGRGVNIGKARDYIPDKYQGRLHFLGELSDLTVAFTAADIILLPSRAEAFSNAVGEGMGFGRMAIVTRTGDMPYLVGESGIVVERDNVVSLKEGLLASLNLSPEEISKRGLEARTRIFKEFFLENVIESYVQLYEELHPGAKE